MCGILAIFGEKLDVKTYIELSKLQRHRGGDETGYYTDKNCVMCHERLSLVGIENGKQPLYYYNEKNQLKYVLIANGEIYNHRELKKSLFPTTSFYTESDCEIILHLYEKFGETFLENIDLKGMFAFVLYDIEEELVMVSRDHIGIIPLYYGYDVTGNIYFSSEMKTLKNCYDIQHFRPGTYMAFGLEDRSEPDEYNWYEPKFLYDGPSMIDFNCDDFKHILTKSVKRHMLCDAPYGVLLSGGLDSSLIASIASKLYPYGKLKTFCIGLEGSPDLEAAKKVADFLQTEHYSFTYTLEEGLEQLKHTVYYTETYDTTTIRASTPMILMAKKIKELGIKMVLTGEVSDEIWGSYAYFQYAPNEKEFTKETMDKLLLLNRYDLLRCNKSMMAHGIEARVPYADKEVISYVMNLDPKYKMWGKDVIEKYWMRKAFDNGSYLPDDLLWRKKEQFSDGVGYSWVDSIQEYAKLIMKNTKHIYKKLPNVREPETYEEKLYRMYFEKHYNKDTHLKTIPFQKSIACSTERALKWMKDSLVKDPSGRAINEEGFENKILED